MNKQPKQELFDALMKVVLRISDDEDADPAEIAALPEIATVLLAILPSINRS